MRQCAARLEKVQAEREFWRTAYSAQLSSAKSARHHAQMAAQDAIEAAAASAAAAKKVEAFAQETAAREVEECERTRVDKAAAWAELEAAHTVVRTARSAVAILKEERNQWRKTAADSSAKAQSARAAAQTAQAAAQAAKSAQEAQEAQAAQAAKEAQVAKAASDMAHEAAAREQQAALEAAQVDTVAAAQELLPYRELQLAQ